jgi:hypothetical protein
MIAVVQRHRDIADVLTALYAAAGAPRLIGGTQRPPEIRAPAGPYRRDVQRLSSWLSEPLSCARPDQLRTRAVWHCTVTAHALDRALTDQQWAAVAAEIMHQSGLARRGDSRAVRWIAARHGTDHLHVIATLARMDGTAPPAGSDISAVRKACHAAEDLYGLSSTRRAGRPATGQRAGGAALAFHESGQAGRCALRRPVSGARRQGRGRALP